MAKGGSSSAWSRPSEQDIEVINYDVNPVILG